MNNLPLIIQREYMERVRKKSFLITTILMPLIMVVLMVAPALIINFSTPDHNRLAIVDPTGNIADKINNTEMFDIVTITEIPDSAVSHDVIDGYIVIPADIFTSRQPQVQLLMNGAIPLELNKSLNNQIEKIVEDQKLQSYNIEDLSQILNSVKTEVTVNEIRLDKEEGTSLSSGLSYIIGIFMSFILYMFLLMYGQMVMTSIIEEKNNRVLELVVSSVKPLQLMMGKIIGIGLVAVTQIIIWGVIICFVATLALPALIPAEISSQMAAMQAGTLDPGMVGDSDMGEMVSALSVLTNVGYIIEMFVWLTAFLVGGFLLYASMFAAVGSAVDNVQDASQLQVFIIIPIIISLVFSSSIGNAPNSDLAIWLSMIPFTSPMVMMSRLPLGVPEWQPWVSLVILYASFVGMVWIAGKIYRVGIFMYGKKPNLKELWRWAKYK